MRTFGHWALGIGAVLALQGTAQAAGADTSPARPAAVHRSAATPEQLGFDSARLKRLDAAMAEVVASGRVPGMS